MILFLDFDGVLHPRGASVDQLFCRRGAVWRLLDALPELHVVVSSSWRDAYPVEQLTDFFVHDGGEHLVDRILGATPCVVPRPHFDASGLRELECLSWLAGNGFAHRPWLAIDDTPSFFSPGCRNLHWIDGTVGLTRRDADAILQRLAGAT